MAKPKLNDVRAKRRVAGEKAVTADDFERPSQKLFAEAKRQIEEMEATPTTSLHPLPPPPTTPTQSDVIYQPVSPTSNYFPTSNDEIDEALRLGLFKGASYETYKVLFRQTIGHVSKQRARKFTNPELEKLCGITHNTLRKHLRWLEDDNWIKKTYKTGDNSGCTIEVRAYKEIKHLFAAPTTPTYHPLPLPGTTTPQDLVGGVSQQLVGGRRGMDSVNTSENESANTLINTKNTDDEPLAKFSAKIEAAARKLTGKGLLQKESDKWGDLADLLILELEVAAARAGGVSSVPAFLTEVLRRQFFAARQQQKAIAKTSKAKPDTVGKSDSENFEIKALDVQGRELALEELKEFAGESFLDDFKKWYTDEDWQWLTSQLKST